MSNEAITWAFNQDGLTMTEKFVLIALADYANEDHMCFPAHEKTAKRVAASKSTVQRAVKGLEDKGLLRVVSWHRPNGSTTSNRYQLRVGGHYDHGGSHPDTRAGYVNDQGAMVTSDHPITPSSYPPDEPPGKNTKAPAEADAAFEAFWDSYPATRKGGKDGPKGARSKYKTLARELTDQGLMDRLQHYKRTRARLERSGEFVPAVPHVTTWLNQHRWDDFGEYKPGPVELTADEVNQILGPDHWAPESPDGGFQTVEEELEWRQAAYAARLEERKQRAKEVVTGGTVRQDS